MNIVTGLLPDLELPLRRQVAGLLDRLASSADRGLELNDFATLHLPASLDVQFQLTEGRLTVLFPASKPLIDLPGPMNPLVRSIEITTGEITLHCSGFSLPIRLTERPPVAGTSSTGRSS